MERSRLGGAVVAMFSQAVAGEASNWRHMTNITVDQSCRSRLGEYIEDHVDKRDYIASSDLGAISYKAIDHHFVDLIALTSADILTALSCGDTADAALEAKHVRFLADTYDPVTSPNRLNQLLEEEFPKVRRNHNSSLTPNILHSPAK